MKKIALLLMFVFTAMSADAAGMVYDPAEYKAETSKKTEVKAAAEAPAANKNIETKTKEASSYAQNTVSGQSSSFSNALYELDSAQVNIRNQLLEYQAKYQEVDNQYKLIKEQRRVLAGQIREITKKVNAVEKSKNQIRKTMT